MKGRNELQLAACLFMIAFPTIPLRNYGQSGLIQGVWNNSDFSRPPEDWLNAARRFGGQNGLLDLVVAQADIGETVFLPFPFQNEGYLNSSSETDQVEPYLKGADSDGLKIILSIQPLKADILRIIEIVLTRYGHHDCIIGINIDLEWKLSGVKNHASNAERDLWLNKIKSYKSSLKLFLTYFEDYTYFPDDSDDLVVLFDGAGDAQVNILKRYSELAKHFDSVGIYTGFSSSAPPVASNERIIAAVPKTEYIIHTEDVFPSKPILIFEMDDIQVGWLESTTIKLIDLHIEKSVPLVCGVIPYNLDNPKEGSGYLPILLKNLNTHYTDLFEIGQQGYTADVSEELMGKSYEDQRGIIEKGMSVLSSLGIKPATFIPPFGSADETTVKVAEDLGFKAIVNLYENTTSSKLLIVDAWISLTEVVDNKTVFKSPDQIMAEIDNKTEAKAMIILCELNAFQNNSRTNLMKYSDILDVLKDSEKYQFVTTTQYQEQLIQEKKTEQTKTREQLPTLQAWSMYIITGVLAITVLAFLLRRKGPH